MGLSADDIASARATLQDFMPDQATVTRTGATVACQVKDGKREERAEGLPSALRFRRWHLKLPALMPNGSPVDAMSSDTVTVAGDGTYYVMDTVNPRSYPLSTDLYCIRTKDAAGNSLLPLPTPVQVWSFTSAAAHLQTHAYLYDPSSDLHVYPDASGFTWAAVLDKTLGIKATWKLQWTDRDGVVQTGTIKTIRESGGVLPLMVGYVLIDKG